jgi:sugar O-acyltransferase (sialic acid O-acetyltransferase NeuD family)
MNNLIIIGARGYGREVYNLAIQCNGYDEEFIVKGFLDNNYKALDCFTNYPPILSSVEDYNIEKGDVFVCALGSIEWKKHYSEIILSKGGIFINLVHPSSKISLSTLLGKGILIFMHSSINDNCEIQDFVTIQGYVSIENNVKIGKWTHINAFVYVGDQVIIGNSASLNVRATILPRLKINNYSIVGANSYVESNVGERKVVFGTPAIELSL